MQVVMMAMEMTMLVIKKANVFLGCWFVFFLDDLLYPIRRNRGYLIRRSYVSGTIIRIDTPTST